MEQSNINKNEMSVIETRTEGNAIIVELGNDITAQEYQVLSNQMKEIAELLQLGLERNQEEIRNVKKTIETNYITPEELKALESLIDKKARNYVDKKKGIQLNIDVVLNYDVEGLAELQKLINNEVGKTKSKIWVDLNKDCLERKGTEPKNRIPKTQVERAFDFVRTWGGFSV